MIWNPRAKVVEARQGVVLLAVLVVLVLLSLAAYQFSELMMAEYKASDSYVRSAQAKALADSGVHFLAAMLSNPDALNNTLGGNPYDNAGAFQGVIVDANAKPRLLGRFSVLSSFDPDDPASNNGQGFRFGVSDECGKINLNALMQLDSSGKVLHDMLLNLPNMTEDVANSILDWIDPDDDERTNGAENQYYQSLSPGYRCKNGPLDSLEELLLVKGVTPQLLFGNDINRNGILDPDEDDGTGTLDRGWAAYLTVYSREKNVDSQGNPRIYINSKDLNQLATDLSNALSDDLTNYILAYRQYGGSPTSTGGGAGPTGGSGSGTKTGTTSTPAKTSSPPASTSKASSPVGDEDADDKSSGSKNTSSSGGSSSGSSGGKLSRNSINLKNNNPKSIASLYELINSQVSIPNPSNPQTPPTIYPSPLNDPSALKQLLPLLLDKCTTSKNQEILGRINVNTASRTVLTSLPGLSDTDAQSILDHRPSPSAAETPDPIFQTPTWLITEANLKPETLKSLDRYVTTQTQVYRAQVVGYFDAGGPSARFEVIIDTNQGFPRVVYQRELSELGKGFNLTAPNP